MRRGLMGESRGERPRPPAGNGLAITPAANYHRGVEAMGVNIMRITYALAAIAALGVSPVYAACTDPGPAPNIPDGTTASANDIMTAQKSLQDFDQATNTYLDCIKKQHDAALAANPGISTVDADKLDKDESTKHNAAVESLNSTISKFNASVAAYKAKNAPKKPALKPPPPLPGASAPKN